METKIRHQLRAISNANLRKITGNNPKLELVNINAHTQFCQVLSISSKDIQQKLNFDKPRAKTLLQMCEI